MLRAACCLLIFASLPAAFAAKENFDRSKPHLNIGTIGHIDHGKTTLTAALAGAFKRPLLTRVIRFEDLEGTGGVELEALFTKIRTDHPQYWIHDFDPAGTVKNMVLGALLQDGAILVVAAAEGPTPQTREHILLARQVGVPSIVVFMNVDGVQDPDLLDLVELEVRQLLARHGYHGDNTPIVRGSALGSLAGEEESLRALGDLMNAMDAFIPRPIKPADQPFLMPIEDVFAVTGRGTVATGRIETGRVRTGDELDIVGLRTSIRTEVVSAIEIEGEGETGSAEAGDNVGLLLRGIDKEEVVRGQVLAKPGSIRPHSKFKARLYMLTPEEGGGSAPLFHGYRPQFYLRTTAVTGQVLLRSEQPNVVPGENAEIEAQLILPVAMNKGLRFVIREGSRTIGAGRVTEIPE